LIPYLVVPKDLKRRKAIRDRENELVEKGVIQNSERTKFENKAKFIALSSASYTCEYLYRKYDQYLKEIQSPTIDEDYGTYFVSQMGWDSVPEDRMDKAVIKMASSNEANLATFQREYCAKFIDGSDSYFSMNKMLACSVPDGQEPTMLVQGDKKKKYILSIDPNFSNSETADHFAMCVLELDDDKTGATVVHSYAEAGKDLKDHIQYLYYIYKNFNIEMILIDYAGYQFIDSANESELFRKDNIELKIFDFTAEKDGAELTEELKKARRAYNKQIHRIVFTQYFTSDFIRKANEWLQGCIDYKKIWFGSSIKGNPSAFDKALSANINVDQLVDVNDLKQESPITYFIDNQEVLIKQTRYQCAAIEVKTTAKGVQSFDLPLIMKRDNNPNRQRRDSYTALMLGAWAMKCYAEIMAVNEETGETFSPFFV
jgi:hypothetical protein